MSGNTSVVVGSSNVLVQQTITKKKYYAIIFLENTTPLGVYTYAENFAAALRKFEDNFPNAKEIEMNFLKIV